MEAKDIKNLVDLEMFLSDKEWHLMDYKMGETTGDTLIVEKLEIRFERIIPCPPK